ncbi:MAG: hypothetical protein EAZ53_06975 [Bacteroidetes bacterium]|nr:MAG: hypothetical protein EAZ53_06975 [Bacteroidota bacterium]
METILMHMKQQTPACLEEFEALYAKKYVTFNNQHKIYLNQLPEAMVLGLLFEYMNENAIDFTISDISTDNLKSEIMAVLKQFEETIKHFS